MPSTPLRLGVFAAALVASSIVAHPDLASAFEWRHSATYCMSGGNSIPSGTGELVNHSGQDDRHIACPVPHSNVGPANSLRTLNLHVNDLSTSSPILVWACVKHAFDGGSACGQPASSGAGPTGNFTLRPELSAYAHWGSFPYLQVSLPGAVDGSKRSRLYGYYGADF